MTTYGAGTAAEDTLRAIERAVFRAEREQRQVRYLVREARASGVTWTHIAEALGVTRQAATQRYGPASACLTGVPREPGE